MFENLLNKKNLSIERLATLCHVAEAGSIRAAAGDNPSRQSLYSRQIKELGEFLAGMANPGAEDRIELLDDRFKPSRVNEAGQQLSQIARDFLVELDDFAGSLKGRPSKLVIGAGESLIQWLLIPCVLPSFKKIFPDTNVIFRNLQTQPTIDALRNGEIDMGFVRKNAIPESLSSAGSFQVTYRLFIPKKFRAKFKSPVTLDQIAGSPLAVLEGVGQFRTTLEALAKDAGVKLSFVVECSSSTQVALLVARKECCAILPGISRAQLDESIDDYPVKGLKSLERTLCFAWNPKRAKIRLELERAAKICAKACRENASPETA